MEGGFFQERRKIKKETPVKQEEANLGKEAYEIIDKFGHDPDLLEEELRARSPEVAKAARDIINLRLTTEKVGFSKEMNTKKKSIDKKKSSEK